jgi:uncharacterized protein involved in response to NO
MTDAPATQRTGGIPRGLLQTGPVLFSYGFRPFFLGGAVWAVVAMTIWIAAISGLINIGGDYGAPAWHAHEMMFGFAPAVLTGFLLTAVPNWTGRLPVAGRPLMLLFLLWCAGRVALLIPDLIGTIPAAAIDSVFLPAILVICVREIVAGKKWKDLKIVAGLLALSLANLYFHYETIVDGRPDIAVRLGISAYAVLVTIVGGRMIPSFTRNWINRFGRTDFPAPFNSFDTVAILSAVLAFGFWTFAPQSMLTAITALSAAALQTARLIRWRGWTVLAEPLVSILHGAYAFVPLGLASIGLSALGVIDATSTLHILTVGLIATMMLAVMTRATRGHTGRDLTASKITSTAYLALIACAFLRPLASQFPEFSDVLYPLSGVLWLTAFGGFLLEYGPMLVRQRRKTLG